MPTQVKMTNQPTNCIRELWNAESGFIAACPLNAGIRYNLRIITNIISLLTLLLFHH